MCIVIDVAANRKEKTLMLAISQTQDSHGSFKISYPITTCLVTFWYGLFDFNKTLDFAGRFYRGERRFLGILVTEIPFLIFFGAFQDCL